MGFVDSSEKLIRRTIVIIMCTSVNILILSHLRDEISSCGQ